ncbi:signal peptidase 22 kDa subunit [Scleroderma citrinum]
MHSIFARINSVSSLLSTCMMVLLAAVAVSSLFLTTDPKGKVDIVSLKVYNAKAKRYPFKEQEFGFLKFDIDVDLQPLFNWNTKQLFIYLEAEYSSAQGKTNNTIVLWDRIVRRKEDAHIVVSSGRNKYKFKELSESFKNASPAEFSLKYNVMPYVGLLTYGEAARTEAHEIPEARDAIA